MDKKIIDHILTVVLVVGAFIALLMVLFWFDRYGSTESVTTSDTVIIHDTIREVAPVAHDSIYIRKEVARLKVINHFPDVGRVVTGDTPVAFRESRTIAENATTALQSPNDSVDVEIPIMQKIYATKQYKAWISGYHPNLDSIEVYQDTKAITNTITIRQKPKRWGLGIDAGYGVGKNGLQPYVGVGVSYNILRW